MKVVFTCSRLPRMTGNKGRGLKEEKEKGIAGTDSTEDMTFAIDALPHVSDLRISFLIREKQLL
jgi:hypothetical protein